MKNKGENTEDVVDIENGEISLQELTNILQTEEVEESSIEESLEEHFNIEPDSETKEEELNTQEVEEEREDLEKGEEPSTTQEKTPTQENKAFNKVKSLIEYGVLEDTRIALTDDEEDEGVLLSEFEDISEEQIDRIKELQKEKREKELQEKYIPKENLSEQSIKLINILREGGDVTDILSSKQSTQAFLQKPFENVNLESTEEQKKIAMYFYTNNQKMDPKEAAYLVKKKEEDFELDTFAKKVVNSYQQAHTNYVASEEKRRIEEAREKKKAQQQKAEALSNKMKEEKFKKPVIDKIVSNTLQEVEGRPKIYSVLDQILENPEENYEVLLHLLDRDSFNELYKIKTDKKTTENVLRLADTTRKANKKAREDSQKDMGRSEIEEQLSKIVLK